ncbi:MAG: hypothetical protein ACYDG4_01505 [Desulfuromonadaceae bacterium]
MKRPHLLLLPAFVLMLAPAAAHAINAQVECDATYRAWSIDPQMKEYLRTHTCVCDERSNSLSCTPNGSTSAKGSRQAAPQPRAHRKTTNGDIMREALKGALADYAADSARVSAAVAAQSKANQAMVKEQNALKNEALLEDEAKKRLAIQNELAAKKRSSLDLAVQLTVLPPSGSLSIDDALRADTLMKQSIAKRKDACRNAAEAIARFEAGMPKLEADMDKNRRLIADAEKEIAAAAADAGRETAGFFYNKKYDELEDRLKDFMKTKKQLQLMKKEINGLAKVAGLKGGSKLTPEQIVAARKWIDDGIKYSDDLVDSVKMSYTYNSDGGPKSNEQAEGFRHKALGALSDFNTRFMNDAGGWEFAGEHLSEAVGGPAGKLMFKQAVLGIKLTADAGSIIIDGRSIKWYRENQEILELEKSKRLQRIIDLRKIITDNRCDELG